MKEFFLAIRPCRVTLRVALLQTCTLRSIRPGEASCSRTTSPERMKVRRRGDRAPSSAMCDGEEIPLFSPDHQTAALGSPGVAVLKQIKFNDGCVSDTMAFCHDACPSLSRLPHCHPATLRVLDEGEERPHCVTKGGDGEIELEAHGAVNAVCAKAAQDTGATAILLANGIATEPRRWSACCLPLS